MSAIQSIRIATNLTERFGVVIRTGDLSTSTLELAIGEAEQLYPEIWRHLDQARAALVAEGRDVSAFEAQREDELDRLGVTDVDGRVTVDPGALMHGRLRFQNVKTATFNRAGYQRAVAACRALMAAMPEVDWDAVARDEQREIAAAGSLRAHKWVAMTKWLLIVVAGIAMLVVVYRNI